MEKVGEFDTFTAEDCYGKRILESVKLDLGFYDISKGQSTSDKVLKFLYAEELSPGQYKQIDDLGFGTLVANGFSDNKQFYFQTSQLIKESNLNKN
jgi:hypothetical protein